MAQLLAMRIASVGLINRYSASQAQRARDIKSLLLKAKYDRVWASKHMGLLQDIQQELDLSLYGDKEFSGLGREEKEWQAQV